MKAKVPNPFFLKQIKRFLAFFITSLAVFLLLTAQVKQGDLSWAGPRAMSLENSLVPGKAMLSSDHLASTGGIAFFQNAKPADHLKIQSLAIQYQPNQSNGYKIKLKFNGRDINCTLPDWQIIPLAKYVDSPYNACITLSGNLVDKSLEQDIKESGGHVLNYHPAFRNTILGWYLKQSDIMLLHPLAVETPDLGNQINWNHREYDIPRDQKESAFQDLQEMLLDLQSSNNGKHRSWLISDNANDIVFDIINNNLTIEAKASFYCWRFLSDAPSMIKESTKERLNSMKSILQHEFETDLEFYNKGHYSEKTYRTKLTKRITNSLPPMLEFHYNIAKINLTESELNKLMSAYNTRKLPTLLKSYSTQKLVELWNISTMIKCLYHIVPLEKYSQSISASDNLIRAVNPAAWDATISAIKYSAFFRYVKQNFPKQWKEFMVSINRVGAEEILQTPTALYPSDNIRLKQLLN